MKLLHKHTTTKGCFKACFIILRFVLNYHIIFLFFILKDSILENQGMTKLQKPLNYNIGA